MKKLLFIIVLVKALNFGQAAYAQSVGVSDVLFTPDASSMLDVRHGSKGVLIPRISLVQTTSASPVTSPATSLLVYNEASINDVTPGFYFWSGTAWVRLLSGTMPTTAWALTGNAGTVDGTHFIGTTDGIPFNIRVNNQRAGRIDHLLFNTFFGFRVGNANTTGIQNTALGHEALEFNTTGTDNTATGLNALRFNTTGNNNSSFGRDANRDNITGSNNTASGHWALRSNVAGSNATAIGTNAMQFANNQSTAFTNTNVAVGFEALRGSLTPSANIGSSNTAIGYQTLVNNTSGVGNTATGMQALLSNTSAVGNSAIGLNALRSNTLGNNNSAIGVNALFNNTIGTDNVAVGREAGFGAAGINFNNCTFIGAQTNLTVARTNVTMLGFGIGNAQVTGDNQVVIGNTSIVGWGFGAAPTGVAFRVGSTISNGNGATLTLAGVWTNASDSTKKHDIININYGLNEVMKLRPVNYQLKGSNQMDFGFLAQEVKHVLPEIVHGEEGQMTLSYGQITAVLTKAMQEQQKMIEGLRVTNDELKTENNSMQSEIEELKTENSELQTSNFKQQQEIEILNSKISEIDDLRKDIEFLKSQIQLSSQKLKEP